MTDLPTNTKSINMDDLEVLNLNAPGFTILHWLTVLLKNRSFRLTNPIAKDAKEYLLENFPMNTENYDVIIGYRADDSYFSFAEDFMNNAIPVKKLEKAMYLGNFGEQVVLILEKAFCAVCQTCTYYTMGDYSGTLFIATCVC